MLVRNATGAAGRRPRAAQFSSIGRAVEALETRDLPALVVGPLALTEGRPFNGPVATFAATDLQGALADYKATVDWGDGSAPATATVVADGPKAFDVVSARTYTRFGTFPVSVTVTGLNNSLLFSSGPAVVSDAALIGTGTAVTAPAGRPFSGVVGTFQDNNAGSTVADFTALIRWGDGQSSFGTVAAAPNQTGPLRYSVSGTHTYATPGVDPIAVTVVRAATGTTVLIGSKANVIAVTPLSDVALVATPVSGVTATSGIPFTGPVLTFNDTQAGTLASQFSATVNWGDGRTSPATVIGQNGAYTVLGTHTYAAPGTYQVHVTATRTASGFVTTGDTTARAFGFNGFVDRLSLTGFDGVSVITNQQEPILSGTAAPRSVIQLTFRRANGGDPFPLGETVADETGHWSLIVGPLAGPPIRIYGVAIPADGPPTPITLLNGGLPLRVVLTPSHGNRHASHPIGSLGMKLSRTGRVF